MSHALAHATRGRSAVSLATAESLASATESRRWVALDLFRFVAVVLMVQGHSFFVTTSDAVRAAPWYSWHNYVHGFTAPMFLFAAGLAFAITTFRRWDEHIAFGKAFGKRIERYALLLGIGYALQVPGLSLGRLWSPESPEELARTLKIDALHHIGLVLLVSELLVLALRTRARFAWAVGVLGAAAVLAGPAVWRLDAAASLPLFFAAWVNDQTGSIFPLVPWSGFIFAGMVTGWFVSRKAGAPGWQDRLPGPLALAAAAFLVVGFGLDRLGVGEALFGPHNFWKTGPSFFLWRLGVVLLVLASLGLADGWLRRRAAHPRLGPAVRGMQTVGQETLVVYVAHLLVLYGSPVFVGVFVLWHEQLGLVASLAVVAALFVAMVYLALGWHRLKTRRPDTFQWVRLGLLAVTVAVLLLPRPF